MSEAITRETSNHTPAPAENAGIELDKLDDKQLEQGEHGETAQLPNVPGAHDETIHGINAKGEYVDPHQSAGLAVIEQRSAIPTTGKRLITSKWEYWLFVIMYFASNGSPMSGTAGNLRQAMIQLEFPDGYMHWAGSYQPVDTVLLDLNGILFAVQLVVLFAIGPYADYGSWRPWILIVSQVITWGCELGMIGIKDKSQWAIANGVWIAGNLAQNVFAAFYFATYPGLVRDLPRMIKSEQDVAAGLKTPEDHAEMDSFERAKIFNLCNVYGSMSAVFWFGIAIGISHAVGYASEAALIRSYRILLGYYTPLMMLVTIPFFIVMKWRPGQQVPKGLTMWQAGPKQAWYALKCATQLKQCLLYLVAYFFLFEAIGAYVGVYIILQLQAIKFSPELSSAFNLVGDFAGGAGCAIILYLHKRFHWKVKWILFVSAIFSIFPILWGAVGTWTHKIGYYNTWEFWFFQVWNVCTSAAASYNVTMISEVAPASKLFMFYALFQTLSKTSGFIGPFITAAIIKRANGNTNAAFWFLLALGAISLVLLFFIDTDKAKIDCARLAEKEAQELYSEEQREAGRANQLGKEDLVQAESKV